jgi:predicted small secreted protein
MRKRVIAFLLAMLAFLVTACSNTVEGLEEDANRNVDEAQQELNDEDED